MGARPATDELRATDGDFAAFVRAASPSLHRTAYLLVGSRDRAQDVVQTALTRVYAAWARRDSWDDPAAYARHAVVNVVLSSASRRWWGERPTGELPEPPPLHAVDGVVAERDALRRALAGLPARQRTAVVLRYYLDLSEMDTAGAMNCPVGTVKSMTARGFASLRSTVREEAS
ncbi:MAG: SigE family RNA polymerase sigma factor [Actinomycetota bacterium]